MALLKIISGDSAGAAYAIATGSLKVGRADGNDLRLPDGSVSSSHCVIELDAAGNLAVRDLGSTNGTFIEGQRVREALVAPGQRLRLGNLELIFDNDAVPAPAPLPPEPVTLNLPPPPIPSAVRVPAAPPPVVVAPAVPGGKECANHNGVAASVVCGRCGKTLCLQCTKQQKLGMNIVEFCLGCGGQCKSLAKVEKEAAIHASRPKTFAAAIAGAFKYPFSGNGLILLVAGTIFYGLLDALLGAPKVAIVFFFSIAVFVMMYGYLFAYLQRIVTTSSNGEMEPPDWPEVTEIQQDIVQPFLQLLVVQAIAIVPSWVTASFLGPFPGYFVLVLGLIYFPMALLSVLISDSFSGLNPVFVLSSIMKAPKPYIGACIAFGMLYVMYGFVRHALYAMRIPFAPYFFYWFLFLLALMISMRILGMFYYLNRKALDWGY